MNKNIARIFAVLVIIIVLISIVMLSQQKKQTKKIVTAGYSKFSFSLPLFVALENGYFKEEGLEIKLVNIEDNAALLHGVISKKLDIASSVGSTLVFSTYTQDRNTFRMIHSNFDTPKIPVSFIIVKKDSGITKLEDLGNKKIGVLPAHIHAVTIQKLLQQHSIPKENVDLVTLASQLQPQALASGNVDALYTVDPAATIALEKFDNKILQVVDRTSVFSLNPYYGGSSIISAKFIKDQPETARKVIKALDRAVDYIHTHDKEAKIILSAYTPLDKKIAPKLRSKFFFLKHGVIDERLLQKEADVFFDTGIMKEKSDVGGIVFRGIEK